MLACRQRLKTLWILFQEEHAMVWEILHWEAMMKGSLDPASRPLTTFKTPLGRLQLTRLPQGATNSVAVYQAQMMWILQDEIPENLLEDDEGKEAV
ncbi:hypothetical protein PSTG_13045 [Puccinia striiformis f. sp. tritici PST-78]|uniref:Uncharacterized protein n=1 Tax=Puccinia striiformis f. sp. tritici PST-78 TaxID=1165861 RepID=A0A0L0V351_9BASI|nr:hypothetical protein PSTG_13045 [Puccinia striiformis f. sp. tritici PST-78]